MRGAPREKEGLVPTSPDMVSVTPRALLKNEQDVHLFERLAFIARRDGR